MDSSSHYGRLPQRTPAEQSVGVNQLRIPSADHKSAVPKLERSVEICCYDVNP